MKILCVIDSLSTGGAQRQIINLARGLHQRGHDVSMFCYAPGALLAPYLEKEGIPVHIHLKSSRFSLDVVRSLWRSIDEGKHQVVVSFLNTPNFYSVLSARLSKARPAVLVSERFCDIPGYPKKIEMMVRYLYHFATKVIVNSHHQRKNFLRRYKWLRNRVVTVYNGYDLREFIPPTSEPENAQLQILAIASVSRYKNGLCLVRALNILKRDYGLRAIVNWVGQRWISGDNGAYLAAMEAEIKGLDLAPQWQWLNQRTDIAALLRQNDVLVHPSYGEGLPNVVCEAMASGRPVIVSNTLDHPYLIKEGVNGFLFNWQDPNELARKIKIFTDLPSTARHDMGKMGRVFAEKNLSMDRYVNDYEHILSELAE